LRNRRLFGLKFVRQEPVGPFIVDFISREAMLAIEVDGATHSTEGEVASDRLREAYLKRQGLRVLRFSNEDIYRRLDDVVETIVERIENPG
jgi:very-short-patch-repair endonuclease